MSEQGWGASFEVLKLSKEASLIRKKLEHFNSLEREVEDLEAISELLQEEDDRELQDEYRRREGQLLKEISSFEIELLFSREFDFNNAIVSIHPGAGGTESQDWAEMLLRMYTRWAESRGFSVETVDLQPGNEAGIKSVTFIVKGDYAYGYLRGETGVHRLVRISPFDAAHRRHTSFASVEVIPEIAEEIEIEIRPEDIKIDTFRASGAGGQYVNKTDSAVRITHIPTGIVVQCQNERSQYSNKLTAMKVLKARLYQLKEKERREQVSSLAGEKREIAWGSQIRSYVFYPYQMVKDHCTGIEVSNVKAVMDGEIDVFIEGYLRSVMENIA